MKKKNNKEKINIPAILKSLCEAEKLITYNDEDMQKSGKAMKHLFERVLAKRQKELREAIEISAKLKKTKFWREQERE